MKSNYKFVVGMITLVFAFTLLAPSAYAVECSSSQKNRVAKAIASRDIAMTELLVARSNLEFELTYQRQLTTSLTSKHTSYQPSTNFQSLKDLVRPIVQKRFEKENKDRERDSVRAIDRRIKDVADVQKKYDKLSGKIPTYNCTF